MQINEKQRDALKRVYDEIITFLDEFQRSDGFNNYWYKVSPLCIDAKQTENTLLEIADNTQHKVELALAKEYFDLHKLPIYSQLEEYVCDDLCETFEGKLSYAYRFEAPVERWDGTTCGVTTEEDYARALKKINDMLEPFM